MASENLNTVSKLIKKEIDHGIGDQYKYGI